ncbi:hypothetical protein [Pediococcus argentinicus]|uniref:Uncharacterized protein n=1 Tax=Pediococcus argentinicus TaxID=480391 RepID=A0A0R2NJT3_9LACO|nr:hypothetical protein [Pediococcus argentinicus]KRO26038.1 hypothetical protein IV88_GL000952 [Pediococcus argentinicus]NKZ21699.1 hypothetical protein [Pediococcus argentinicus]GEP18861.1 hypothetical protein LSA03_02450 [Pediococcus argentinicus]
MTEYINVNGNQTSFILPDGFQRIDSSSRTRNKETVQVIRYQPEQGLKVNGPHVTVVIGQDGRLISYNNFSQTTGGKMPSDAEARRIAEATFEETDPEYASGLSYMRIDHLKRQFINDQGEYVEIPISWVKFAHTNGSYNWVSVGPDNQIFEMERESYWNYWLSRRATEEWNYDNWVLAREGKGPQPAAPEALA